MKDLEIYCELIQEFVKRMTDPEMGQYKLEVPTFRLILEKARSDRPALRKLELTAEGRIVNDMEDIEGSLEAARFFLKSCLTSISSLMGDELAGNLIERSMEEWIGTMAEELKGRRGLLSSLPSPFKEMVSRKAQTVEVISNHDEVLNGFSEAFSDYLKELGDRSDLSALKLKLNILREQHELIKFITITKNNNFEFDRYVWDKASDLEVKEALLATFNSVVGLATLLTDKDDALKRASRTLQYYFDGKEGILKRYGLTDELLGGALQSRISSGIKPLDRRMKGGLPKGGSILLISPSGIERELFLLDFITKGLRGNSSLLWVLSKDPPRSARMLLRSRKLNPKNLEEDGKLRIVDWFSWRSERIIGVERDGLALKSSKILSNLGIAINKALRELSFSTSKIGVVHLIGPVMNIFKFQTVYNFIQRLRAKFKEEELTAIFLLEADVLGQEEMRRVMEIFDGTLEMERSTENGRPLRRISVLGLSGIDIDTRPVEFEIKDDRMIPVEKGPMKTKTLKRFYKRKKGKSAEPPPASTAPPPVSEGPKAVRDLEERPESLISLQHPEAIPVAVRGEEDSGKRGIVKKKLKRTYIRIRRKGHNDGTAGNTSFPEGPNKGGIYDRTNHIEGKPQTVRDLKRSDRVQAQTPGADEKVPSKVLRMLQQQIPLPGNLDQERFKMKVQRVLREDEDGPGGNDVEISPVVAERFRSALNTIDSLLSSSDDSLTDSPRKSPLRTRHLKRKNDM